MANYNKRHIYLGGNTRTGFVGFYNQLTQIDPCNLYILKGGPGTGKSTFIKKVIGELDSMGYRMDIVHCSGDPDSLDGVICPNARVIVVDGTAPHSLDPYCAGARDNIINLGDFWDCEKLQVYKDNIASIMFDKQVYYNRAYSYLAAAGQIYDDSNYIVNIAMDDEKVNQFTSELSDEIFGSFHESSIHGTDYSFFATSITPGGRRGDIAGLVAGYKTYSIKTFYGINVSAILELLRNRALCYGFNTQSLYCGFDASVLEHLIIPELGIAIVTSNSYHAIDATDSYYDYPIDNILCDCALYSVKDDLKYNVNRFDELIDRAIRALNRARIMHAEIEKIYYSAMDFHRLNIYCDSVIKQIVNK